MKATKFGFAGSVTVIGFIYLIALALAPTPGLSAQNGHFLPVSPAAAVDTTAAAPVCPYTLHAGYVMDRRIEAHHENLRRPRELPARRGWRSGRLTVF